MVTTHQVSPWGLKWSIYMWSKCHIICRMIVLNGPPLKVSLDPSPPPPFQRMDNRFSDCPNVQLPIVQLPHGEYPAAWDGLRIDSTTLIGHLAHISIKINGHVVEVLDATVRKVD